MVYEMFTPVFAFNYHPIDIKILSTKIRTTFIKIVLRVPSTLHSTRAYAWLGLAISSRIDARAVEE